MVRRLAQPHKRAAGPGAGAPAGGRGTPNGEAGWRQAVALAAGKRLRWIVGLAGRKPRYAGVIASLLLIAMSVGYGTYRGDHGGAILDFLRDTRDAAANATGFRIATVSVTGSKQFGNDEILAAAGITPRTSLLFLDVEAARKKLESTPWIAQASVRKLYPGRLEITVEERQAFALWQKAGKLSLIAADGTVLGPLGERRIAALPLVVGPGAAAKAHDFLAIVERYPMIREQLRAAVLVAERRWTLKLRNGLDIRLPAIEIERALDTVMALDRDKKLLSRDLMAIDLRLPDRVTVRLSDEAAQARAQSGKDKKKKKGGDA